jgi:uncharacterized protein
MNNLAQKNADSVWKKHGPFFTRLIAEAVALVEASAPIDERARRLLEITDDLADKVAPKAVCRRGCSHCCYQSVTITDWEAARIARYTGRTAMVFAPPTRETNTAAMRMRTRFAGDPCPFLTKNQCSIYAVRPFACRTHFNVGNDPGACDIIRDPGRRVPYFNFNTLTNVRALMFFNAGASFADVREFFPPGSTASEEERDQLARKAGNT